MAKYYKVLIIAFLVFGVLLLKSCGEGSPPCNRICYMVDMDNPNCRISSYEANTSTMRITSYYLNGGQYQINRITVGTPSLTFERRIKGTEINYGLWSANSNHDLSYEELFYKKNGYYPDSNDLNLMTDQIALNWFKELFNCNCVSNEDPINVSTYKRYRGTLCTDYPTGNVGYNEGNITFSDGTICQLELNGDNLGADGDCPRSIPMKVKKPCSKCN